jgi:hypothetical protein
MADSENYPPFEFEAEWVGEKVRVFLPHQCSDWDIGGGVPSTGYATFVDIDQAIDRLAQFIREATDLLWKLKDQRTEMMGKTDAITRP